MFFAACMSAVNIFIFSCGIIDKSIAGALPDMSIPKIMPSPTRARATKITHTTTTSAKDELFPLLG